MTRSGTTCRRRTRTDLSRSSSSTRCIGRRFPLDAFFVAPADPRLNHGLSPPLTSCTGRPATTRERSALARHLVAAGAVQGDVLDLVVPRTLQRRVDSNHLPTDYEGADSPLILVIWRV